MESQPPTITWIASYPKSGNTWVRFLAANLLFGKQESAATLSRVIADVHELDMNAPAPDRAVLVKTHFPFSPRMRWAERTAGAVYVVRNPFDVMISNFHYLARSGGLNPQSGLEQYVRAFIANRGDRRWRDWGFGDWVEHVQSWVGTPLGFPVLRLGYEKMLGDPAAAARELCRFFGVSRSEGEIQAAVENSSFAALRRIEESDIRSKRVGIFYKPYLQEPIDAGLRFMRSGQSGQGGRELSSVQREEFLAAFGPTMRELGYSTGA